MWSILPFTDTSAFSASSRMLSGSAALSLFICLMAMLISSIVVHVVPCSLDIRCCPFQPWHLGLSSEWLSPLLGTPLRLTAAYHRIGL
ncbi:unnamed protein product [Schistosoma mattheei]|uniref:Uncharacterized protein n=1 Tax=Schistosoma mattheei TaxID=31246 RepID=A0A183PDY4_9TREM|nr:unnamed protein product [Schistosoma mattheei]